MEEFGVLGHMPIMEKAVAYMPGFRIKLMIAVHAYSN